jgi:hypothetical protein
VCNLPRQPRYPGPAGVQVIIASNDRTDLLYSSCARSRAFGQSNLSMSIASTSEIAEPQSLNPKSISHIFCEHCVHEWLTRERTCPLCRAVVRTQEHLLAADGTTTLLPLLF